MKTLLVNNTLAEQIRTLLRDDIVNLRLEPGSRLVVESLATRFGVSRTPVRDALHALAEEGLVVVTPRVGYYVIDLSTTDILEISGVRKMVELYAFQAACRNLSKKEIEKFYQEILIIKKLPQAEQLQTFDDADRKFHLGIVHAANNKHLLDFYIPVIALVDLVRNLDIRLDDAIEEHIAILKPMLSGDHATAQIALERHLDRVEKSILEADSALKA